jgi:16S rRNA (cytosine967-C5)-methyltransferase
MTAKHSVPNRALNGDERDRAAAVLVRVAQADAYAAPALSAALDRAPALTPAQRGLCTELVYGVLRSAAALDAKLAALTTKPGSYEKLDAYTRAVLQIAAYQLLVLQKIPARAAVHTAVNAIKKDRSVGMGGFVNAMLQKLGKQRDESLCEARRTELALASVGPNIRAALTESLGDTASVDQVLTAMILHAQDKDLRVETSRTTRAQVCAAIGLERPEILLTESELVPTAVRLSGAGDLRSLAVYREGLVALQERGSQAIALACEARQGMTVFDACAGRGGKTAALASAMNRRGTLHAADCYPNKLERIEQELERLQLLGNDLAFDSAAVDLTRGLGALHSKRPASGYDLVLIDAPCSGLGTLAKRPEIITRRERLLTAALDDSDEPGEDTHPQNGPARASLMDVQRAILQRCAPLVAGGGTLVYAVCTLAHAEGVGMRDWFLQTHSEFESATGSDALVPALRPHTVMLRPDQHGTDGYVFWRARRRK